MELFEAAANKGLPAPFDLMLTDMLMDGLDGLATCKAILKSYPTQKVIIMSGYAPDGYEHQIAAMGAQWLNKPFSASELAHALRKQLDRD